MDTYKDMYFHLFNAITDALEAPTIDKSREILCRAQMETEEWYICDRAKVLEFEYKK